ADHQRTVQPSRADRRGIHARRTSVARGIAGSVIQLVEIAFGIFVRGLFTAGPFFNGVAFIVPRGKTDNRKHDNCNESFCQGSQSHWVTSLQLRALYLVLCTWFFVLGSLYLDLGFRFWVCRLGSSVLTMTKYKVQSTKLKVQPNRPTRITSSYSPATVVRLSSP